MKIAKSRVTDLVEQLKRRNAAGRTSRYSLEGFCKENGLLKDSDVDRGNYKMISCPFHSDSTPSCQIKHSTWRFQCFSCGLHGDWVEFVRLYENYQTGSKMTRTQLLERTLKDDLQLQADLGFSSIYTGSDKISVDEIPTVEFTRFQKAPNFPLTFAELSSTMIKKKCSKQQIHFAIAMMQSGATPSEVYRQVFNLPEVKAVYDLSELED